MTYHETLSFLHSMPRTHTAPTLARMERLLAMLGNPEKKLAGRFLHVTGTNGKGSVCAFLTSALRRQGYHVGRFISPFIMEFRERMEIDGEVISEAETAEIGEQIKSCVERYIQETGETPLEFELVTLMGLLWFSAHACDLVVMEVGIGGTFDATNVITPLLSVIVRVDYDHTELLGNTLAEIAAQKSGIIKAGAPCVCYADNPAEVREVIAARCRETGSQLVIPKRADIVQGKAEPGRLTFTYAGQAYTLALSGLYQVQNAVTAIEALRLLPSLGYPMTEQAVKDGLSSTTFPARFEVLSRDPMIILDGAHNTSGMQAMADNIAYYFQGQPLLYLCGMLRDKNPEEALSAVLTVNTVQFAACITPPTPRAMAGAQLAEIFTSHGIRAEAFPSIGAALAALKEKQKALCTSSDRNIPILCFGSLYMAGDVRRECGRANENV